MQLANQPGMSVRACGITSYYGLREEITKQQVSKLAGICGALPLPSGKNPGSLLISCSYRHRIRSQHIRMRLQRHGRNQLPVAFRTFNFVGKICARFCLCGTFSLMAIASSRVGEMEKRIVDNPGRGNRRLQDSTSPAAIPKDVETH